MSRYDKGPCRDFSIVMPGLYVGKMPPPTTRLGTKGIHLVVFAAREYQPKWNEPGVKSLHVKLDDDFFERPSDADVTKIKKLARQIAEAVASGKHVLVTCQAGLNRSALLAGIAMRILGLAPDLTVKLLRAARGPLALSNPWFSAMVKA